MLIGHIPAIHAIECDELVFRFNDARLPVLVARSAGAGQYGLYTKHPRAMGSERKPLQHNTFSTLDVDRHEVDFTSFMFGQHGVKGRGNNRCGGDFEAARTGRLGLTRIKGAKTGARDAIES